MTEPAKNSEVGTPAAGQAQPLQVRTVAQYIKDLSFENPNVRKLIENPSDPPNLRIEVNVNASKLGSTTFESVILFKAEATNKLGVVYDLELAYGGTFQIENLPEPQLEPFLLIHCPSLLFPFVRRLIADLTREGGFPPLLLDPIDFAALFIKRQQEKAGQIAQAKPAN
jgi:preprotein translocase subunit SecB